MNYFSENKHSLIQTESSANHGSKVDQNIPHPLAFKNTSVRGLIYHLKDIRLLQLLPQICLSILLEKLREGLLHLPKSGILYLTCTEMTTDNIRGHHSRRISHPIFRQHLQEQGRKLIFISAPHSFSCLVLMRPERH